MAHEYPGGDTDYTSADREREAPSSEVARYKTGITRRPYGTLSLTLASFREHQDKIMFNEVYPELPSVLARFLAGLQNALGTNFVGAYLVGSLATGDYARWPGSQESIGPGRPGGDAEGDCGCDERT